MKPNKKDVCQLLEKIAIYLELKGENSFKISAYLKAAQALEKDVRSLEEIDNITAIKGIGKGTGTVIKEYMETGQSKTLNILKEEIPSGLLPLLQLPGLGGKKIAKLYQMLHITDAASLRENCENGTVEQLNGFGKKTAEKIIQALDEANHRPERLPIAMMLPICESIETYLQQIPAIHRFSRAGSMRRMRETNKDIDFIIATEAPEQVRDKLLEIENVKNVIANGQTKVSITLENIYDVNIDFRMVEPKAYATTLHHFTGSKDHNVAMRQLAKRRGEKISEYGVENEETGEIVTFDTEKAFFNHFDIHEIPPEVREDTGEIAAFQQDTAPSFITLDDIRGDLHMHTTWSDGAQSIEEMVNRAREKGYEYMAITDHSKFLKVANGLDETRLRKQGEEIARINQKYQDILVLAGVEMDILPDGNLDFSDEFLREMDFVIGAIHSSFGQSQEKIMARLFRALDNPYVSLIAHPTGRLIGKRAGYDVDLETLIHRAKETKTALEINANPNRLDLSAEWVRYAQKEGVKIAIDTDAHSYQMLEDMKNGVGTARKGWLKEETVLNTWTKEELLMFINQSR